MRAARRHRLFVRAMAGAHEDRPRAGAGARGHVQTPVADRHRPLRIERQLTAGALDHARRWFTTRALLAQLGDDGIRMMRTEVVAIDARVAGGEPRVNGLVHVLQEWLVDDAAADPALVG